MKIGLIVILVIVLLGMGACSKFVSVRNDLVTKREAVNAAWSAVDVALQRRADLIPNLVNTVKGYAKQEETVLREVTEARAHATQMTIPSDILTNPQKFHEYEQNQAAVSGALGRLLAVSEKYPDLKSNQNFLALQSQLEGTENRITVARNRYIKSVQDYNVGIRTFPNNLTAMVFGYKEKANFTVDNEKEISTAPKVDFNPAPAPAK